MKKRATIILMATALALTGATSAAAAGDAPECHGYYATAHTGDFDLSVCRANDNQAIDEAIELVVRIAGDSRYVEYVSVVYIP